MTIERLQKYMKEKKIDFCLFYNLDSLDKNSNIFYFTGYEGIGALIVGKKKKYLIAPDMEFERAKRCKIRTYKWKKNRELFELIKELNKKSSIKNKKIGVDKEKITLRIYSYFRKTFKKSRIIDISDACLRLRKIKTKSEIKIIRKACRITDNILKKCLRKFKWFKTEIDVASFLENEINKAGCDVAFKPITASGSNSSMPHYTPKNVKLKKGFCIIDFGVRHKGYCSDITRTVYIGRPKKKEIEMYDLLLSIQNSIIKDIKEGIECSKLVKTVKKRFGKYKNHFIHGLGHGLGIEVHELPNLKEESKDLLKGGMVFTIEPGIYFPKRFGIRIEDDILLDKNNKESLTKTTKNLIIFKKR